MSKAGKKIIKSAKEAIKIAQGDIDTIKNIKVTPSCGCVFCDLGLAPDKDNIHRGNGHEIACNLSEVERLALEWMKLFEISTTKPLTAVKFQEKHQDIVSRLVRLSAEKQTNFTTLINKRIKVLLKG